MKVKQGERSGNPETLYLRQFRQMATEVISQYLEFIPALRFNEYRIKIKIHMPSTTEVLANK